MPIGLGLLGICLGFNQAQAETKAEKARRLEGGPTAGRKVVDEHGVEFRMPLDWPEEVPIPRRLDNCVRCHIDKGGAISAAVLNYAGSTHDLQLNSCVACHGGDPKNDELAHEVDFLSGYRQLMARCNECHPQAGDYYLISDHFSEKPRWDLPNCSNCHDNHSTGKAIFRQSNSCNECHGVQATMATGAGESRLIWKSRKANQDGNRIAVRMNTRGTNQELVAQLLHEADRDLVDISLATDAEGQQTSLAMDIVDAVTAHSDLYYLVSAEEGYDALGDGIVKPHAARPLKGGASYEATFPQYKKLVDANDNFREALSHLMKNPKSISYKLQKQINYVQWETMILLHGTALEPDSEMMDVTIEESGKAVVKMKEALAEWQAKVELEKLGGKKQ